MTLERFASRENNGTAPQPFQINQWICTRIWRFENLDRNRSCVRYWRIWTRALVNHRIQMSVHIRLSPTWWKSRLSSRQSRQSQIAMPIPKPMPMTMIITMTIAWSIRTMIQWKLHIWTQLNSSWHWRKSRDMSISGCQDWGINVNMETELTIYQREIFWNSNLCMIFIISGSFSFVCSHTLARSGSGPLPQASASLRCRFPRNTLQRMLIFEYISIACRLITRFTNLNSSDWWFTNFHDGCACIYSILRS
jgi:hypothetical protein